MLKVLPQPVYERLSVLMKKADNARSDWITPVCMMILMFTSIFFIYSAQSYSGGSQWKMQIVWVLGGLTVYGIVSIIDYKIYLEYGHFVYFAAIILLLLLWTPMGVKVYGAMRWLNFKAFSVQPSDTAKIGTLILASGILARSKVTRFRHSLNTIFKVLAVFSVPILLIFLQPDLGSCLVFPPMLFALLYVSKLSGRFFVTTFVLFALLLGIVGYDIYGYGRHVEEGNKGTYMNGVLPLKDYQRNRILTFVAPDIVDPRGIGDNWNLRQSLIAIGSGGLVGKGHNNSTQAKLGYLPQSVAPNDFIFSVLAEEKGFIGGFFVIILYSLLLGNGLRVATLARDRFGMYLATGISVIFMVHIFINIGMTIGIMPITGLPLPFLSYGGSFVISCCILQGLIQSIYRFRKNH